MMAVALRDYQIEMLSRLEKAWGRCRSVMLQMPTGTGKTVLLAEVIRRRLSPDPSLNREGRSYCQVLIVAHRRELLEQIRQTVTSFGIDTNHVRVESIQKLSRLMSDGRSKMEDVPFSPSLVIIDEAHHALAKTYRMLWDWWPEAKFLGLTATPCRMNGEAFTDLFDVLLQSYSIQVFIDRGWLSDFDYVSAAPDSKMLQMVASLGKRGADGDYQQKEMATVMDVPESIAHLYDTYKEFVEGRKGIVYAIDRQHGQHIADYYRKKGVRCQVIDSKTPAPERQQRVGDYKQGKLDVLVNVDIFGEGFDVPEVEFIQLARPTLSLSKYLQQVGRGMRRAEGKEAVSILDNVGLYQTFGLPTEERDWSMMFYGKMEGKGCQGGQQQPIVIRECEDEKTLVNLQMVRIKQRGEKHEGLELFLQNGKYGVMRNGVVTCSPEFEHIERIKDGRYYAIASYPYVVFKGKSTIISLSGQDMKVSLYGKVLLHDDVVEGESISGDKTYWDGISGRYYSKKPVFEWVGGVSMACENGKYLPRRGTPYQKEPVEKGQIWYNNAILWMDKIVIMKRKYKAYPIVCYGMNCFYVRDIDSPIKGYLKLGFNGKLQPLSYQDMISEIKLYARSRWSQQLLTSASTGKEGFPKVAFERERSRMAAVQGIDI